MDRKDNCEERILLKIRRTQKILTKYWDQGKKVRCYNNALPKFFFNDLLELFRKELSLPPFLEICGFFETKSPTMLNARLQTKSSSPSWMTIACTAGRDLDSCWEKPS